MDPEDFEEYPYEVRRYKTMHFDTMGISSGSELEKKLQARWHVNEVIDLKGHRKMLKEEITDL